jgi:hypothetical protein
MFNIMRVNIKSRVTIAAILLLSLIPSVLANTNVTFSQGLTFTTKYGLRVPFGIENIMPPAWAFLIYNGISLGLLFFIGGYASLRSTRFSIFCIDAFAAIFWWFGWMSFYQPASDTVNWWSPLSLIILAGVMGGAIYLKEANRERYGTGGTGLTLINALYYFILLQTVIGFVNVSGIWNVNSAVTPSAYQYNNVNLGAQVSSNANTGGFMGGLISTVMGLGLLAIQAGQMILTVIQGIVGYDIILFAAFPWITLSPIAMAFVWIFRVVILLLDGWFIFLIFFKPPALDQLGV